MTDSGALSLHMAGPCSASAASHMWVPGDTDDLVSLGRSEHADFGVTVALGRCRYCALALLALAPMGADDPGADGLVYELRGAEL